MSTTFVIMKQSAPFRIDNEGCVTSETPESSYTEIAFRSSFGISWVGDFQEVGYALNDYCCVYPIDNTPQGIYTIGNIKAEMLRNER